jgi:hypothetical protein
MIYANQGHVVLNPRHIERVVLEQRFKPGTDKAEMDEQYRALAYTPDGCYGLTGWTDEQEAREKYLITSQEISRV